MGVAEEALSATRTVSPVLYAVVLAVSQIYSVVCALASTVTVKVESIAKTKTISRFIEHSITGRTRLCGLHIHRIDYASYSQTDEPVWR